MKQLLTKFKPVNDILQLYTVFILSIIAIYLAPKAAGVVFQVLLLILFYKSKYNYFWLAFVFIIENFPGTLFSRYTGDIQHTFSILPESPAGTLYFWMVFILIALLKALKTKESYKFILKENIILLFGYFIFLVLIFGLYKVSAVTRTLLPWLLLLILPRLLKKEEDFSGFFRLIFSFVFFVLFTQTFQLIYGISIAKILVGSNIPLLSVELEDVARPTEGIFIPFLAMFGSLYYLIFKKKIFDKKYLRAILGFGLFSIFITATRSWLIASLFIFIGYYVFISREKLIVFKNFALPALFLLLSIQFIPILYQQADLAFQRYETVALLLKGDVTAGGTLVRLDVRSPRVLAKFYESPVIGWGYGSEANKYSDGHVGNQNMLMQNGVIGYLFWLILWVVFILKMMRLNKLISNSNPYKNVPRLFILMIIGILFVHSSAQWFDFLLQFLPGFTIIFLFTFASFIQKKAIDEERILKLNI